MATESQLKAKALKILGVLGVGVTPSGPKDADMQEAYNEVYAELDSINLVEWANGSDIPNKYVDTVANLMASKRVEVYPVSTERYQRIMSKAAQAENKLRRLMADSYVSDTTPFVDY